MKKGSRQPMPARGRRVQVEELLPHADWLRRLARALVSDESADDVVQETWFASLRRPRREPSAPRAWLRAVARNVVRSRFRSEQRRHAREALVVSLGQAPVSPAELAERSEVAHFLATQMDRLREPYRQAIVMRYLDDLSCAEIARVLGVPAGTVRRRLKVGLDQLRSAVQERRQGRRLLAALPLLGPGPGPERRPQPLRWMTAVGGLVLLGAAVVTLVVGPALPGRRARGARTAVGIAGPRPSRPALHPPRVTIAGSGADATEDSAGVIEGVVTADDGRPAEAIVTLTSLATQLPIAAARTVADGHFRFLALDVGRYALSASGERGWATREPLALAEAGRLRVGLALAPGAFALEGKVTDHDGLSVPGSTVTAWEDREDWMLDRVYQAPVDEQGRYRLLLPPGRYRLRAVAPGYARSFAWPRVPTARAQDLALVPLGRVAGRVIEGGTGRPVTGAVVSWRSEGGRVDSVTADAAGRFLIAVEAGAHVLWARRDAGYGRTEIQELPAGGEQAVTVVMSRTRGLYGRILSEEGRPLGGVTVSVTEPGSGDGNLDLAVASTVSDGSGRYRLLGLPMQGLALRTSAPGRAPTLASVGAATGEGDVAVDLRVRAAASVDGVVRSSSGTPAAGALVMASVVARGGEADYQHELADAEGAFTLRGLPSGELRIVAQLGADVSVLAPQTIAAGTRRSLAVTLGPAAWISGTIAYPDGAPAARVRVEAGPPPGGFGLYAVGLSGEDGHFTLGPIAAGVVSLRLPRSSELPLEVRAGERRTGLTFTVPPAR
jgi:RNA polymerase sigma-70 factor (ECF subfamily)